MTKPTFVNAVQWKKMGDHPKVLFFGEVTGEPNVLNADQPVARTPLGLVSVSPGNWIIEDDEKNIYVMENKMFKEQFEKVVYGA
jgi:hypothetical protein